jgi:iron complex transport system permease protein
LDERMPSPTRIARSMHARRELVVALAVAAVVLAVAIASLVVGSYTVSVPDVFRTLAGQGDPKDAFIVLQLRLPRVVVGVLAGMAFAIAGAIFQALLSNPLASPDIIGITGGASAAAVAALLVLGLGGIAVSAFAFVGALAVAAAIYALSWRSGITGNRFVLIGIGFAFMVQGLLGYLLTRADVRDAQAALVWLVGSLSGVRWGDILIFGIGLLVLVPAVAALAPRLRILQLGDPSATGLGLPVSRTRLLLLLVAVALAALGTAAVGPIAFVAFVSAPIARRLTGTGALALVPTALVGILVVLVADFVSQHALPGGVQVPAGIITGAIGAPYLLWLLATTNRSRGDA